MAKRLADWLEKISVAALAVGLFQLDMWGLVVGIVAFCWCMYLTKRLENQQ